MLEIRTMSNEDLPFAVRITGQMKWDLVEDDFKFMMELEPEGCFVMFDDGVRVGLATTISYGNIGWFGNLVVNEAYRNKGAGSELVNHSIKYLRQKQVKTIGLYAYEDRVHFYSRLGFEIDSDFVVMKGKGFPSRSDSNVRRARENDITQVIEFDELCFGSSRKKLLEPILTDQDNLCYIIGENGRVAAYAVAKVYRGTAELGPLVCPSDRTELAFDLLESLLSELKGVEASVFLPKRATAVIDMLTGNRFDVEFGVVRMYHGTPMAKNCLQTAESLERG